MPYGAAVGKLAIDLLFLVLEQRVRNSSEWPNPPQILVRGGHNGRYFLCGDRER